MVDVTTTIASANLNILGGPATVEVSVDYGQRGDRGSLILYGQGKPSLVTHPTTPIIYDMYINLLASDDEYQWVYQYISKPGGPGWKALFKLQPNTYSSNTELSFVNGSTEVWIPVTAVTGSEESIASLVASNFNIQHSFVSQNPIAASVYVSDISLSPDEVLALPITIKGAEFLDGEWTLLSGEKIVHLFITVV